MPSKLDLALQNTPLSKQFFKTQPQIENEDVTWSPQYNMPATRTNKSRALSLQEVELDGWSLIRQIIVLKTCTYNSYTSFNVSFVFHSYILGSTSWIWTNASTKGLKLSALRNETHTKASILNIGDHWILMGKRCRVNGTSLFYDVFANYLGPKFWCRPIGMARRSSILEVLGP